MRERVSAGRRLRCLGAIQHLRQELLGYFAVQARVDCRAAQRLHADDDGHRRREQGLGVGDETGDVVAVTAVEPGPRAVPGQRRGITDRERMAQQRRPGERGGGAASRAVNTRARVVLKRVMEPPRQNLVIWCPVMLPLSLKTHRPSQSSAAVSGGGLPGATMSLDRPGARGRSAQHGDARVFQVGHRAAADTQFPGKNTGNCSVPPPLCGDPLCDLRRPSTFTTACQEDTLHMRTSPVAVLSLTVLLASLPACGPEP